MKEPKVKFYPNIKLIGNAICLFWIDEIHVDESLKDHPLIDDIIQHEVKHYHIIKRMLNCNSEWKRSLLMFYNNIWDLYDCLRFYLKLTVIKLRRWRKGEQAS